MTSDGVGLRLSLSRKRSYAASNSVELAFALQGMELVAAADMGLADPDLGNGGAAAGLV